MSIFSKFQMIDLSFANSLHCILQQPSTKLYAHSKGIHLCVQKRKTTTKPLKECDETKTSVNI